MAPGRHRRRGERTAHIVAVLFPAGSGHGIATLNHAAKCMTAAAPLSRMARRGVNIPDVAFNQWRPSAASRCPLKVIEDHDPVARLAGAWRCSCRYSRRHRSQNHAAIKRGQWSVI